MNPEENRQLYHITNELFAQWYSQENYIPKQLYVVLADPDLYTFYVCKVLIEIRDLVDICFYAPSRERRKIKRNQLPNKLKVLRDCYPERPILLPVEVAALLENLQ